MKPRPNLYSKQLRELAEAYWEQTFERFPEQASQLGLSEFQARLGRNAPSDHKAHLALVRDTVCAVEKIPGDALDADAWLDRRVFLSLLRTQDIFGNALERWRTNPQIHADAAIHSVFDLLMRHSEQLQRILPAIEARLEKIPDYLQAGAECVSRPVPIWTQLTERTCAGSEEFFSGLEAELEPISPHPEKTRLLLRSASRAFREYARTVARKKAGPISGFSTGRPLFEALMAERLGLDWTLNEAIAQGAQLVEECAAALQAEAKKFGRKSAQELLAEAAEAWNPNQPLLELYRETTETVRRKMVALKLVTPPSGESLKIIPVPHFLRHHFPTAAYSSAGPFAKRQVGIFWVNDLSLTHKNPTKARAEICQHFGLPLTCAHEADPGHHLQFSVQYRHPSKIRRLAEHAIFYEGWTLWCEELSVRTGLIEMPHARLIQLQDALWRAYRILIDCGLQSGLMGLPQAVHTLTKHIGFTAARAQGDVNWYTSAPTVPMSYLLGRKEVERLHSYFVASEGWSLRKFNDWMLSHGAVPWSWIWQAHLRRSGKAL